MDPFWFLLGGGVINLVWLIALDRRVSKLEKS